MTPTSMQLIPTLLPSLIRTAMRDAIVSAAPAIPGQFKLIMPTEKEIEISVPTQTALAALKLLLPHFQELNKLKEKVEKNKETARKLQAAADLLDVMDSSGRTPLEQARQYEHEGIAALLERSSESEGEDA